MNQDGAATILSSALSEAYLGLGLVDLQQNALLMAKDFPECACLLEGIEVLGIDVDRIDIKALAAVGDEFLEHLIENGWSERIIEVADEIAFRQRERYRVGEDRNHATVLPFAFGDAPNVLHRDVVQTFAKLDAHDFAKGKLGSNQQGTALARAEVDELV